MPSTLNRDDSNSSQDSQGSDELIKGNQIQKFETTNKQGKPTNTSNHEKSDIQQILITMADQATLTDQPRRSLSSWEDMEGRIGISLHGPCCHGPRVLLTVIEGAQETRVKVVQSTARRRQWAAIVFCFLRLF